MERKLTSVFLSGLMASTPLLAVAQTVIPPTDVDLKAAYCLGVVNAQLAMLTSSTSPPPAEIQALTNKEVADARSDQARLQAYVVPKLQYLDPEAMVLAMNRGKVDFSAAMDEARACVANSGDDVRKLVACEEQAPVGIRTRACQGATFLPY